jgi:glutamyl-tRNA reductase
MDIVISATAAPHCVIKQEQFHTTKPQVIFDLAFPRDVDPQIGAHPLVTLLNLEDIEHMIQANQRKRSKEVAVAEQIISEEMKKYSKQAKSIRNIPADKREVSNRLPLRPLKLPKLIVNSTII